MKKIFFLLIIILTLANTSNFATIYAQNKKEDIGNYITIDFLLNALYLHKKEIVSDIEQKQLEPNLKKFSYRLLHRYVDKNVTDTKLLGYLTTLNMLQNNPLPKLPPIIVKNSKDELAKINSASSKAYLKFKNSGRLKNKQSYFRALTFVTKVPFFINSSTMTKTDINTSNDNIRRGLILADVIKKDKELKRLYSQIDRILKALFGEADDLGIRAFYKYQVDSSVDSVRAGLNRIKNYPKIIGEIIDVTGVQNTKIAKNMLSFRLFSSRYTLDSYLFSRVVFPYTLAPLHGKKDKYVSMVGGKLVRTLPSIRDIELLFNPPKKETYVNYFKNLRLVQKELRHLKRPKSLYAYDFLIYKELLRVKKSNCFRGYYTQNRYLAYAYAKKSHTPTQRSVSLGRARNGALLEKGITRVLDLMGDELSFIYNIHSDKRTKKFTRILKVLRGISTKKRYSKRDIEFLNSLDVSLKNIIDTRFESISVELHHDGNSGRSLVEVLREPTVVNKNGFRGVNYLHKEKFIR